MIRLFKIMITVLYWLQIFVSPFLLVGLIIILIRNEFSIAALIPGSVLGIVLAEYVRQKIGLYIFFSGLYGNSQSGERMDMDDAGDR